MKYSGIQTPECIFKIFCLWKMGKVCVCARACVREREREATLNLMPNCNRYWKDMQLSLC
jgi:hypothetical protein